MTMNVLQLIGSFHQGGSERQAVQLCRLLTSESSVNLSVATLNRDGVLRPEIEALGLGEIPEFRLTSFYDVNFVRQIRRFAAMLRRDRIDIIHTHDFYTNVFGMFGARIAGVPVRIASKRETGGMRTPMQDRIERIAFGRATRIVVNAAAVRERLVEIGIDRAKPALIYNGLDLDRLRPTTDDRAAIRRELGLPAGRQIVTLVANLRHPVKNQPMFLRVAELVSRQSTDVHFAIAGEGDLRPELESAAARLGIADRITFLGRCTRVPDLLAGSFAGVLTSFNEGFSNSLLEYMAAGIPVVATDVGGASEAIVEGETGFLVASDDAEAMATRLIGLLADAGSAAGLGAAGRRRVEERFSCAAQLSATLELYDLERTG